MVAPGTPVLAWRFAFTSAGIFRRLVFIRTTRTANRKVFQREMSEVTERLSATCTHGFRAFNSDGDVVRVACNQWRCDVCRQVLSYRWARRVRFGLALWNGPQRHWTLTLSGKVKTPQFAFRILDKCWDNLRKRIQRANGAWDYAAFVELHPRRIGIAHFHVISLADCPGRINDVAHHAGFGYKATDTEIDGPEAAQYVSKYTSKQGEEMPKGFRRVRLSRGWPNLPSPAYDVEILPIRAKESLYEYFCRIAMVAEISADDAAARWEHRELDL